MKSSLQVFPVIPTVPSPAKGAHLPHIKPQDWGIQSVALTTPSQGGAPFSSESSPRGVGPDSVAFLPFLPN